MYLTLRKYTEEISLFSFGCTRRIWKLTQRCERLTHMPRNLYCGWCIKAEWETVRERLAIHVTRLLILLHKVVTDIAIDKIVTYQ